MPLVEIEDRGAVRHVVMARPEKRNALSGELVRELGEAFREAAADDSVRCVVVRGDGAMFSSGMDLADLGRLAENPETVRTYRREILVFWNLLEEMTKPTIAQIHGACLGGAMELALACDMRTMAEDAVAGLLEARIGLIPDAGSTYLLPRTVGMARALELALLSEKVDAAKALEIGLVNRVVPAERLLAEASDLCRRLAALPTTAIALTKRIFEESSRLSLAKAMDREAQVQDVAAATNDHLEGVLAFLEKRTPTFTGT